MVLPLHRSVDSTCAEPFDPRAFLPMLPQRVRSIDRIPDGWAIERLWDGMRTVAGFGGGVLCLAGRGSRDFVPEFPELAALVDVVSAKDWILDGEIVCIDESGRCDLTSVISRVRGGRSVTPAGGSIRFAAYDLLAANGIDVRERPWRDRRALLERFVSHEPPVVLAEPWWDPPQQALREALAAGSDGIVARNPDAPYQSGMRPTKTSLELFARRRASFVVIGATPLRVGGGVDEERVGALQLAARLPDGSLRDAGKVGSGMDDVTRRLLANRMTGTTTPLVVDVEFANWTAEGRLRHPTWLALRDDLHPDHLVTETD